MFGLFASTDGENEHKLDEYPSEFVAQMEIISLFKWATKKGWNPTWNSLSESFTYYPTNHVTKSKESAFFIREL